MTKSYHGNRIFFKINIILVKVLIGGTALRLEEYIVLLLLFVIITHANNTKLIDKTVLVPKF